MQAAGIKAETASDIMATMDSDSQKLNELLERTASQLEENNRLLRKLYRYNMIGLWARTIWFVLLIGLPFALYFYVLEPYFTALGASYETFSAGVQEIPGWKQFNEAVKQIQAGRAER
jgi:hypothetical protein